MPLPTIPPGQLCECCGKYPATDRHHKFPQTRVNRKLYGKLLDNLANIQFVANRCHASHRSVRLIHWREQEFCSALGIPPRSKTAKAQYARSTL